jgi:magnesium chelatase family protein
VEVAALVRRGGGETSAEVRERVLRARAIQRERALALGFKNLLNSTLTSTELGRVVTLDAPSQRLLEGAVARLGLSARAFSKILRVARTSADLDGVEAVGPRHVTEAIQGRILDRSGAL